MIVITAMRMMENVFLFHTKHCQLRHTNFNSFMCKIISDYVSCLRYQIIYTETERKNVLFGKCQQFPPRRTNRNIYGKISNEWLEASNNSFPSPREKKRNFYQIRFTIWILKTFAVLITLSLSLSPRRLLPQIWRQVCHTWNKFILTKGGEGGGGKEISKYNLNPFSISCAYTTEAK